MRPALFDAFPALEERIPWRSLGRFPTAVERVDGLLPPSVELWVKREDESGAIYGGNKVRKLEFLLGAAQAAGAERVRTVGGIGSHHVLATALYGRELGLAVEALVFPQPVTAHVEEQARAHLAAGAALVPARSYLLLPLVGWRRRPRTYFIAPGGSSPTGTLGYVSAGVELRRQIEHGELPPLDAIYVALGSSGTAAGLLLGLGGLDVELVAVRVVDRLVTNGWRTRRLAQKTAAQLGRVVLGPPPRLRVEHRYFGSAYGLPTPAAEEAVRAAATVGLRLEPTYTGKAMAALLHDARSGRLDGKRVLFVQTYNSVELAPLLAKAPPLAELPLGVRQLL